LGLGPLPFFYSGPTAQPQEAKEVTSKTKIYTEIINMFMIGRFELLDFVQNFNSRLVKQFSVDMRSCSITNS